MHTQRKVRRRRECVGSAYQRWLKPVLARISSAKCGAASSVNSFWTNLPPHTHKFIVYGSAGIISIGPCLTPDDQPEYPEHTVVLQSFSQASATSRRDPIDGEAAAERDDCGSELLKNISSQNTTRVKKRKGSQVPEVS